MSTFREKDKTGINPAAVTLGSLSDCWRALHPSARRSDRAHGVQISHYQVLKIKNKTFLNNSQVKIIIRMSKQLKNHLPPAFFPGRDRVEDE